MPRGREAEPLTRPAMDHLRDPGLWDPECWTDERWNAYLERRRGVEGLSNWIDQIGHRVMALWTTDAQWLRREAAQWPSKQPADTCEDTIVFYRAKSRCAARARNRRRFREKADALLAAVREIRPWFLT